MNKWILVLMEYIDRMVCINRKESGEDYARKIIEFLETAREARRKKKKEEKDRIKWNVSAEVFQPAGEKGKQRRTREAKESDR